MNIDLYPGVAHATSLNTSKHRDIVTSIQEQSRLGCEYVKLENVSPSKFREFADSPLSHNFRLSYSTHDRILIVKMPGFVHETITGLFRQELEIQLTMQGVSREVTCRSSPAHTNGTFTKMPDACWAPRATDEITVVLETASSESAQQLKTDAHGWIESIGDSVKTCITIDFRGRDALTFQVWQLGRKARWSTRLADPALAICVQSVEVRRESSTTVLQGFTSPDGTSKNTPNDCITLELGLFVGRPRKPHEKDIVFDAGLLRYIASEFWMLLDTYTMRQRRL
jgi:hypothetical protein